MVSPSAAAHVAYANGIVRRGATVRDTSAKAPSSARWLPNGASPKGATRHEPSAKAWRQADTIRVVVDVKIDCTADGALKGARARSPA
jgi:hypothetical protein